MGPLLYTLYTNELPNIIKSFSDCENEEESQDKSNKHDHICCYADDTTMTTVSTDHISLSEKLSRNYEKVSNFMVENKLQLNNDKSHLLVFSSSKRKATTQLASLVEIRTPTNNIRPSSKQRLLGCWLQDNLKWTEHIRDNEESLMKSLNKRLNALKIITKISDFKTRKMIGEGIFLSKLVYMISVCSGCAKDLLISF